MGVIFVHLAHRHLMRAPVILGPLAIDFLGTSPTLGGAQYDHRPARTRPKTIATSIRFYALDFADIMQGMMKPLVYGFILTSVGCYKGLTVRGGTQGVGRATTQAVVVASVMIIAADLFLTKLALFLGDKIF